VALGRRLPLVSDRPAAKAGLKSERILWPERGPGVFEQELESIEDALMTTTIEKAVAWAQTGSMWPERPSRMRFGRSAREDGAGAAFEREAGRRPPPAIGAGMAVMVSTPE